MKALVQPVFQSYGILIEPYGFCDAAIIKTMTGCGFFYPGGKSVSLLDQSKGDVHFVARPVQ